MGLQENIRHDPVSELPLREVILVQPGTTVREAAARMREKRLGCVFIVNPDGRPIGKFTERKLMRALLADAANIDAPVDRFMYHKADEVSHREPIMTALRIMNERSLRFLCVVDDDGKPIGLTGQKGVMEYIAEHFPRQVKVQRMRAKLFMDQREGA